MGGSGGCRCPRRPCSPRSHHPPGDHDRYVGACQVQPPCAAPRPWVAPRDTPRVRVGILGGWPEPPVSDRRVRRALRPLGRLPRPWGPASGRVGCIASPHPALAEVSPVPAEHGIPRGHPGAPRRPPMAGLVPALSQQPGALPPLGDDTSPGVCFCPLVCPGRDCQAALHFRSGSDTAGLLRSPQEASDWWR